MDITPPRVARYRLRCCADTGNTMASSIVRLADCPAALRNALARFDTAGNGTITVSALEDALLKSCPNYEQQGHRHAPPQQRAAWCFRPGMMTTQLAAFALLLVALLSCTANSSSRDASTDVSSPHGSRSSSRSSSASLHHRRLQAQLAPPPPPQQCCACPSPPPVPISAPPLATTSNATDANATANGTSSNTSTTVDSEASAATADAPAAEAKTPSADIQIEDIPEILGYLGVIVGAAFVVWLFVTCFIHPTQMWKDGCFCKCLS